MNGTGRPVGRSADEIIEAHRRAQNTDTSGDYSPQVRWDRDGGSALQRLTNAKLANDAHRLAHHEAWRRYLAHGTTELRDRWRRLLVDDTVERRDLSVSTNSAGGYLVPAAAFQYVSIGLKSGAPMLAACNVLTTPSGSPLAWPAVDDTSNVGAIHSEGATTSTQDVTFGTRSLSAFMYTSKPLRMSIQLDQDSGTDMTALLARLLERIGRAANSHLSSGTGGGTQPLGVSSVAAGATGAAGSGTTPVITWANLVALIASVNRAYLTRIEGDPLDVGHIGFMTSTAGLGVLRAVQATPGAGGSAESVVEEGPDLRVLGWPVIVNDDLPAPGPGTKSIYFGNFARGYVARVSRGGTLIQRLEERFGDALQIGFQGHASIDGRPDDPNAIRAYQHGS
jgi:HK97 family phage major capsid protein